ncbi:MAG: hypothetical protein ACFB3T_00655 [Geminicoccaceae bacterium]
MSGQAIFWDGGLVSNLPAWVFDAEKRQMPGCATLLSVLNTQDSRYSSKKSSFLKQIVCTLLFGAENLHRREIPRVREILWPRKSFMSEFHPMKFDLPKKVIRQIVEEGRIYARECMVFDEIYQEAADQLCAFAKLVLYSSLLSRDDEIPEHARVRVSIGNVGSKTIELIFQSGFEGCPDEKIILLLEDSVMGESFRCRKPLLKRFAPNELRTGSSAHLRGRIPSDLRWVFCIPISPGVARIRPVDDRFDAGIVVAVDGNWDLDDICEEVLRKEVKGSILHLLAKGASNERKEEAFCGSCA